MSAASLVVAGDVLDGVEVYLELLAKWNRRINLTAFDLGNLTDAGMDRLVVEPLLAARFVRDTDRVGVDIGSGGGSPAFPLKLGCPALSMVLVESRIRKAAFLREVARTLGVDARVETCRFEDFAARPENLGRFDIVSIRAVRADSSLFKSIEKSTRLGGRVLWLGGVGQDLRDCQLIPVSDEGTLRVMEKV